MKLPKRKSNRLKGYDYSSAGAYFVTVCTYNRIKLLSEVVGAIHESPEWVYDLSETKLSYYGEFADKIIRKIPDRFDVEITDYIIMPNHIHMVILINDLRAIRESPLHGRSVISKIVGYLKMNASKEFHKTLQGKTIWQRNYYDHIIRNNEEYLKIAEYIHTNPGKWAEDRFYTD